MIASDNLARQSPCAVGRVGRCRTGQGGKASGKWGSRTVAGAVALVHCAAGGGVVPLRPRMCCLRSFVGEAGCRGWATCWARIPQASSFAAHLREGGGGGDGQRESSNRDRARPQKSDSPGPVGASWQAPDLKIGLRHVGTSRPRSVRPRPTQLWTPPSRRPIFPIPTSEGHQRIRQRSSGRRIPQTRP